MKSCPTCNKTYTDEHLSFCIEDGTPLVPVVSEDRTIPASQRFNDEPKTSDRGDWNASAYQPPSYAPPSEAPKRKVWPWVLGVAGVLILAFAGLAVAIALIVPRMVRQNSRVEVREAPPPVKQSDKAKPDDNANINSNSATSEESKTDKVKTDAPTDTEVVLAQLTDLEHEWTVANINADKKALNKILADDYAGPAGNGQIQGKADYLKNLQRDTTIQKWEFQNLKVNLLGDRATLTGRLILKRQNQDQSYNFVDKFVWRDGRWQATGSEVTLNSDQLL